MDRSARNAQDPMPGPKLFCVKLGQLGSWRRAAIDHPIKKTANDNGLRTEVGKWRTPRTVIRDRIYK
jgi:hypothetical protein